MADIPSGTPTIAGERPAPPFTPEQRGWMVAALVAFLGIAVVGPAVTQASARGRDLRHRATKRMRRLGGGSIAPLRRRIPWRLR